MSQIEQFLQQNINEKVDTNESLGQLATLFSGLNR
jgi:flagellar biosynthesis/type III secretory pathway ATPase